MRPIQKGDWVVAVRGNRCCGNFAGGGIPFTVEEIREFGIGIRVCVTCNSDLSGKFALQTTDRPNWCPVDRLIRIDPPAQPDETQQPQEMEA